MSHGTIHFRVPPESNRTNIFLSFPLILCCMKLCSFNYNKPPFPPQSYIGAVQKLYHTILAPQCPPPPSHDIFKVSNIRKINGFHHSHTYGILPPPLGALYSFCAASIRGRSHSTLVYPPLPPQSEISTLLTPLPLK